MFRSTQFKTHLIFLFAILGMAYVYGIFKTMDQGPYSQHQWRQADCLTITQNYYQENLPFLEPKIHWLGENQDGSTISEFPIVYYSVGNIWKIAGKHFWIYRGIAFVIIVLGLFYLKKLSDRILDDPFWALFIPLLLFTSPVLVYYSNNFLMNPLAFSLAMIAGYQYYVFYQEKKYKRLIYACLIFALAALLKITSLLLFFSIGAIFLYDVLRKKSFWSRWKEFLPFMGTLLIVAIWYRYAGHYNEEHMSGVFLQGLLPIWDMEWQEIVSHWGRLTTELVPDWFHPIGLAVLVVFLIYTVWKFKHVNTVLRAILILISLGIIAYMLLFFQVFNVHEYYLTNLLIIIPVLSITFLHTLKNTSRKWFDSKWVKLGGIVLVSVLCYNAMVVNRLKYGSQNPLVINSPLLTQAKKDYWQWYHWDYGNSFTSLETIEPYLESIGIGKNDRVISIPDQSINISLFLMNRKGHTDFWYSMSPKTWGLDRPGRIRKCIEWGDRYLIINKKELLQDPELKPFLKDSIGSYGTATIFDLKSVEN